MRVPKEKTLKYRMLKRIEALPGTAVVRSEVADLGGSSQISRTLKELTQEGRLVKLGYGVYGKTFVSTYSGEVLLKGGFKQTICEALSKLGYNWAPSRAEEDYNSGRSTQIPIGNAIKLKERFRRKLSLDSMELIYE